MIQEVLFGILFLLLLVLGVLIIISLKKKSFGSLSKDHVYIDTRLQPGTVLYSDALKLKGKPDYILKTENGYIPVEVKTGKTPEAPYKNHIMQLTAYCVLIEENYSAPPAYGVIKYPDREFKIEYTPDKKVKLGKLIKEILELRESKIEPKCNHPSHQINI